MPQSLIQIIYGSKPPPKAVLTRMFIRINLSVWIQLIRIRFGLDPLLIWINGPCERGVMVLCGLGCSTYLKVSTQFTMACGAKMCCNQVVSDSAIKCLRWICPLTSHTLLTSITSALLLPPCLLRPLKFHFADFELLSLTWAAKSIAEGMDCVWQRFDV